ncbi:hypothetical protein [Tenacibaculum aquimarinum]|uniref:hypothetical protein n=1 Tax=Tenacibaculum aquimarinum TaxID=2910675 RepID=UPI001F0A8749|nr:hypothetical protein [Tenacibaculum aquimarinum]MCH3884011.1 hypothetical protein [Tenacibaculum aquimarinum]
MVSSKHILFLFLIFSIKAFSQTGPGGVGGTTGASNLVLWTNPDDITEADNAAFTSWPDLSGFSSDLTQPTVAFQPIIKENIVNGYDVVRFGTGNQRLQKTNFTNFPTTAISGFYVNNTGDSNDGTLSYASTGHNNDFLIFRSQNLRMYRRGARTFNLDANNNVWNIVGFGWTSAGGNSRMSINGTNGTTVTANQNGNAITAGGDLALAGEQDGGSSPYSFDPGQSHQGDFSEVILYNTYINEAERIIVSNYLSAKYNIAITTNNFYDEDTTGENFDFNVAGIGQATDGSNHTDSQGTGIVRINTPNDLQNNEYLFWGEDEIAADYDFSAIAPLNKRYRLNTKWRVSETGEVGTVNFSVNAADLDLTGVPFGTVKLVRSTVADFSTVVQEYDLTLSGGVYSSTVEFDDNDYFTLEIVSVADLSLVKTVDSAIQKVGGIVVFTLSITNNGPHRATGVVVKDLLPTGLQFNLANSNISTGTYNDVTGEWDLTGNVISVSQTISIEIAATVNTINTITNTSEIISLDQEDPDSTPNSGN